MQNNTAEKYYYYRQEFNKTDGTRRKSALFLYLNQHCYNGLIRYNSRGIFNTPFGKYIKPYFPEKEMVQFLTMSHKAEFLNLNFRDTMHLAKQGDVIYCDPPYAPLTKTSRFTDYHTRGFNWDDQVSLVMTARELADRNIQVVISNHDTQQIRKLYKEDNAKIKRFEVRRTISCKALARKKVGEIIAIFN